MLVKEINIDKITNIYCLINFFAMKKLFVFAVLVLMAAGICQAQRAAEFNVSDEKSESAGYNRVGVSFDNTLLSPNDDASDIMNGGTMSVNGFGVDWIHGFRLGSSAFFLETGLNFNYMSKTKKFESNGYKESFSNINLQVPVNLAHSFNLFSEDFSLTPLVGLNFKFNLASTIKESLLDGYVWPGGSTDDIKQNLFSKDDMGDDYTWNRFQMGWHLGVGLQYKRIHLGLQWGKDFIAAYSHKFDDGSKPAVKTGNYKMTLSYCF